jgi:3-methyl-2-oxobutanoate hydroxymethyltransferase
MRITVPQIKAQKRQAKLVAIACYTAPTATIADNVADILLVGDSVGMVLYGMDSTLTVTVDMMVNHGRAVVKSSDKALVVVDMPFGSYQASPVLAYKNAARIMAETGASAVKLEGGKEMASTIKYLVERGVPVMAHIGMQPQNFNNYGGFKFRGRDKDEFEKIIDDARAIEEAGAFAVVIEGVTRNLAKRITDRVKIPTIGIGASPECDGQVLVVNDLLGLGGNNKPRFVRKYAELDEIIHDALKDFANDVKSGKFPAKEHCYE